MSRERKEVPRASVTPLEVFGASYLLQNYRTIIKHRGFFFCAAKGQIFPAVSRRWRRINGGNLHLSGLSCSLSSRLEKCGQNLRQTLRQQLPQRCQSQFSGRGSTFKWMSAFSGEGAVMNGPRCTHGVLPAGEITATRGPDCATSHETKSN